MENVKKLVDEFEGKISTEIRRQEGVEERWKMKLNPNVEELKRSELSEKYITKILLILI